MILLLFVLPLPPIGQVGALVVLVLQACINWPHFMASNRLLYASAASVREHPFAAIYFPAALGLYAAFAVVAYRSHPIHLILLQWTGALWLARHYTGQTWGMMASFSFVENTPFAPRERGLIRWGLHLAMVWHMLWALRTLSPIISPEIAPQSAAVYAYQLFVAVPALLLGLLGLGLFARRLGRLPATRILFPWAAQYLWYALLMKDSSAALVVQLSHAFQYAPFPLRIEENRHPTAALLWSSARRYLGWIILGFGVLEGLPALFALCYRGPSEIAPVYGGVIAAASVENIHQALFWVLELLKKSLDLHSCALLWLDESERTLSIKELITDADAIAAVKSLREQIAAKAESTAPPLVWPEAASSSTTLVRYHARMRNRRPRSPSS